MPKTGNAKLRQKEDGNPKVKCSAVYKKEDSFNCQLRVEEAIQLARNLLQKAQLAAEEGEHNATVHLWNRGVGNRVLYCGLRIPAKNAT
jgi:hypothetical protein